MSHDVLKGDKLKNFYYKCAGYLLLVIQDGIIFHDP